MQRDEIIKRENDFCREKSVNDVKKDSEICQKDIELNCQNANSLRLLNFHKTLKMEFENKFTIFEKS